MRQIASLFALSTAVTVLVLGLLFADAFQFALQQAAAGNSGIIEPMIILGVLLIVAVSVLIVVG